MTLAAPREPELVLQKLELRESMPTMISPIPEQASTDESKSELFVSFFESVYKMPSYSGLEEMAYKTFEWVISPPTLYTPH